MLNIDTWALRKLVLDKADGTISSPMIANAADANGRGIMLSVVQGGTPADLTGCTLYLAWRHENGNQDLTPFTAADAAQGVFKVYYPPAMMYGGKVTARISIYVNDKLITGSRNFAINVERNPIDEDAAMSDENFSTFLQAVIDLNTATDQVDGAVSNANNAAASANNAASAANTAAGKANDAASAANASKAAADTATANANSAATNANNAATSANNAIDKAVAETVPGAVADAVAQEMAKYSAVSFSVNPDDGGLDITYNY